MVDLATAYERSIEAAGVALASGDRTNAERALRAAIQSAEKLDGSTLDLADALIKLGTLKLEMGSLDEAAPLLARALTISEKQLGEDHPDLVILLNELSRLYLKQGAHGLAEPLLLRLLAIKRSKGEDHPEVATVLASLAAVHQALGRHEAAEQLWRRVLAIRERTLAPNHFSLATTLEHLAETCAARGKVVEALDHFQRALSIRELTLGSDHASLRSSRERIADLQLQASEESLDHPDVTPPQIDKPRLQLSDSLRHSAFSAPPAEKSAARPQRETPLVLERPTPSWSRTEDKVASPLPSSVAIREATSSTPSMPATVPYLNVLMNIKDELDEEEEEGIADVRTPAPGGAAAILASLMAFVQPRRTAVMIGAGVVVGLPLIAWGAFAAMRPDTRSGWVQQTTVAQATPRPDSLAVAGTFPDLGIRSLTGAGDRVRDSIAAAATLASRTRAADERASRKASEEAAEPDILVPTMRPMVVRLDSVSRAINARMGTVGDPFSVQMQSSLENARRLNAADFETVSAPQRARLIGVLPNPRYPVQLASNGLGGDVLVRFDVDTLGRPVMSTFAVVSSPHPLLAAAVRKVVPEMRFEPARSPAPASKAIVEGVEIGFKFNPSGK